MAISRDMTATEANILNYIKKYATNEMPVTAVQLRQKFHCGKRTIENIIESLRVNFGHPIVAGIGTLQAPNLDRTKESGSNHGC